MALELELALNHLIGNPVCNENAKSRKSQKPQVHFGNFQTPLKSHVFRKSIKFGRKLERPITHSRLTGRSRVSCSTKAQKIRVKSARLKFFHFGLTPLIFQKIRNFKIFVNLPFARFQLFGWMIPFSCAKSMSWALALSARNASILLIIFSVFFWRPCLCFVSGDLWSSSKVETGSPKKLRTDEPFSVLSFGAPI